jgi:2-polyprenyl-3-methyl-5-hydroxy-6-metoxy-1,4-benzoquinol methylase
MHVIDKCPICSSSVKEYREYYYYEGKSKNKYNELREAILFKIWLPEVEQTTLKMMYCTGCGFVFYNPRPTTIDIINKYQYLQKHEIHIGSHHSKKDLRRANDIYTLFKRFNKLNSCRVLDVGGGDGFLLTPFVNSQYDCSIVDFNQNPLPNIHLLGNTIDDINKDEKFGLIISSHVLEHVIDPELLIYKMKSHLHPKGLLYIEIPFEIWKGIPIKNDPVTHVNFFSQKSFLIILKNKGLRIIYFKHCIGNYGQAKIEVFRALCSLDNAKSICIKDQNPTKFLFPKFYFRLYKKLLWDPLKNKSFKFLIRGIINQLFR